MFHIASVRDHSWQARPHPLLVHIKNKLIVGADLHHKVLWLLCQFNGLAKVQHRQIALRRIWRSDPARTPEILRNLGGGLRYRCARTEKKKEQIRNAYPGFHLSRKYNSHWECTR